MVTLKRATAVRHLVEIAEIASEDLRLRKTTFGWPLVSLWVTGELLPTRGHFSTQVCASGTIAQGVPIPFGVPSGPVGAAASPVVIA